MKKLFYIGCLLLFASACKNDDIEKFEKSADERTAEAIASLKADLTTPANGWRMRYRPENGSGSFWILMKFEDDGNLRIQSDVGADDGAYYDQTITYRIDNSLGLELVLESYSFFSYLFEQNDATFPAEYEFIFANKTPNGELVFQSKSDTGTPTILVFEEADASDDELLGTALSENLGILAQDIQRFSSAYKLTYEDRDLILYVSLDDFRRTFNISTASKKTNTATTKTIDFSTPYTIQGDSIVFDEELSGTFVGVSIKIKGIKFNELTNASLDACGDPVPTHTYSDVTSNDDDVILAPTFLDVTGKKFATNTFLYSPLNNIFNNGVRAGNEIAQNLTGANSMQLYYKYPLGSGTTLNGIGFVLLNADGTRTFALKEFTSTLIDNRLVFTFQPGFRLFENENPDANLDNIDIYLDHLTQGDQTYVYEYAEGIFEFYNPCSGWSFVFLVPN
jgi:Domain of unknown function (DUF4302)